MYAYRLYLRVLYQGDANRSFVVVTKEHIERAANALDQKLALALRDELLKKYPLDAKEEES